jgi:phenylalanyl-tRNA synthetase beta chain
MYISRNFLCFIVPEFKDVSDFDIDRSTYNLGMVLEQVIKHPELKDICIGKVIKVDKIKNSNKLHYASVDVGNQKILKIICGASNFKKGDKVVVALPGAKLYDGRIIEEKELLGCISQGMLCGYNELTPYCHDTLDDNDKNGIIILDKDAEIGSFAVDKELGLDDTLYELTLPSDRPE